MGLTITPVLLDAVRTPVKSVERVDEGDQTAPCGEACARI
jgi:hypothetical protein